MKKLLLLVVMMLFVLTSCEKDKNEPIAPSIPDIKLEVTNLQMQVGATKEVRIQGGKGEYVFLQKGDGAVDLKFSNHQLRVEAKRPGTVEITVRSGEKFAILKVKVIPLEPPKPQQLSSIGIFDEGGNSLFTVRYQAQTEQETYFSSQVRNPFEKCVRVSIGTQTSLTQGTNLPLSMMIKGMEIKNLSSKHYRLNALIEYRDQDKMQLFIPDHKIRIVIPLRR